jgi:hypothetical protein
VTLVDGNKYFFNSTVTCPFVAWTLATMALSLLLEGKHDVVHVLINDDFAAPVTPSTNILSGCNGERTILNRDNNRSFGKPVGAVITDGDIFDDSVYVGSDAINRTILPLQHDDIAGYNG